MSCPSLRLLYGGLAPGVATMCDSEGSGWDPDLGKATGFRSRPSRSEPTLCLGHTEGPFHRPAGSHYHWVGIQPSSQHFPCLWSGAPRESLGLLLSTSR